MVSSAYSPDEGGKWTYLSTPDSNPSWPQGWTTQMSGEIMPMFPGSTSYSSDYAGFGYGTWALYGKLSLTLPLGSDSDGDGLPDFLERSLGYTTWTSAGSAADEWHLIPGNRSTNSYNFSFSRNAGSFSGNYALKASHEVSGWSGNFELKGATGTITFNTANNTFNVALTSFDGTETNGGSGTYQRLANGTIQCQGFTLTSSYGSGFSRTVQPFALTPISGNRVSGTLSMNDGHTSTLYPDYVSYHVELSNPPTAAGRILYVRQNASGANNGSSWANAYTSLQSAIDAAGVADQIWVAVGTYHPSAYLDPNVKTDPRSRSFILRNGTQIFGGFSGTETSLSQRNVSTQATILSGDFGANDSSVWPPDTTRNENAYHVLAALGVTGAILDGVTITGGNANNTTYSQPENGFLVPAGVTLHKYGAALISFYAPVEIRNCAIRRNAATGSGGGIFMGESGAAQLEIRSTVFEENLSTGNGSNGGAADVGTGCTLRLVECRFIKNKASEGGALSVSGYPGGAGVTPPRIALVRCLFRENQARLESDTDKDGYLNYGDGGAIFASYDAEVRVASSVFQGNFIDRNGFTNPNSGHGGAFAVRQNASVKISGSVFTGNEAPWAGGALDVSTWTGPGNAPGRVEVYFSTFSANRSLWGGAINNYYGQLGGFGNIFYGNLTTETRGTAEVSNANQSTSTISNSLVTSGSIWGNTGYVIGANPFFLNSSLPAGIDDTWLTADDGLRITVGSVASGLGGNSRPSDFADVDGDGDVLEALPLDAQGSPFPASGPYHAGGYQSLAPATALPPAFPLPLGAYFYFRTQSGLSFSYQAFASNAVTYSFPGLPAGLTGSAGGLISGTLSSPGAYWFNIVALNANGSATNPMVLYSLPAPATLPFSETFATNPAARFLFVPAANASLPWSSANGRLDYSSPPDSYAPQYGNFVKAVPNLSLSLASNWEISVDVRLPQLSPATDGSPYEAVGLALVPDDPSTDLSTLDADLLSLELGHGTPPTESLDSLADDNFICAYARAEGQDQITVVGNTPSVSQATLRLQYQAATKTVVASYRALPSGSWVTNSTISLDPTIFGSVAQRWGLSTSSTLRVALWADSFRTTGQAAGNIWLDNFSAVDTSQTISFPPIPIKTIGDAAFNLTATASSGLAVTYTSSQTNVATVSGNTVTLRGPGATLVTASQAGNSSWGPASASQWLLVWGTPITTAPFSDDFSSATPHRYFPLEDTNTGARFRITNGYALFSAQTNLGYESPAGITPNLRLSLTNNWTVDLDANIPNTGSTPYTALYFSLLKGDDAFYSVPTLGDYRVKVTTLKLVREETNNSVRVNAHDYALTPSWDFDGPATNVSASTVSLRWAYTAATRSLQCWYDADSTNQSGRPWQLLHTFSLATDTTNSLGSRWGLTDTNQLFLSLSAASDDPGGTAGRAIYFDNLSYRTPPTIPSSGDPLSTLAATGQPASFSVTPSGTSPFTYQWRLNGSPISGATNSTYTISSVNASHAGSYTVVVANSAGSVTSSAATLSLSTANLSSFNYPGARSTYGSDSYGSQIVGFFDGYPDSYGEVERKGFLFQNGAWTLLHPSGSLRSEARGITASGTVVGYFRDSSSKDHGYVYKNGAFTTHDYPSATHTRIFGVDASDETRFVGRFTDTQGMTRGFLRTTQGWTSLMFPSAVETVAHGVAGSRVVGKYRLVVDGPEYGFLWDGTSWTSLGEGRLPSAVTPDGHAIGENLSPWSTSGLATFFIYQNGFFRTFTLPGSESASPYGYDPSTQKICGFYLRQDQGGWNGFTQTISLGSGPLTVTGRFLTPSNTPFANLRLALHALDPAAVGAANSSIPINSTMTDTNGAFQFSLDRTKDYLIAPNPTATQAATGIPFPVNVFADPFNTSLDLGSLVAESTSRTVEIRLVDDGGTPLSGTSLTTASAAPLLAELDLVSDRLVLWQLSLLQRAAGLTFGKLTSAEKAGLRAQANRIWSEINWPNNAESSLLSWTFLANPPAGLAASLTSAEFYQIVYDQRYYWDDFNSVTFEVSRNGSSRYIVPVPAAPSTDPRIWDLPVTHYFYESGAIELFLSLVPTTNSTFLSKRLDLNATNLPASPANLAVRAAPFRVSGRVFQSNATTPLTNVGVNIMGDGSGSGYRARLRTDSQGAFSFPAFASDGEWEVRCGPIYASAFVPVKTSSLTNVSLVHGRTASVTGVSLSPGQQTIRLVGTHLQTIGGAYLLDSPESSWSSTFLLPSDRDPNPASGTWLDLNVPPTVPAGTYWVGYRDANWTMNVSPSPVTVTSISIPTAPAPLTNGLRGNLNQAFSYTPVWSNSPTSFAATNLPPGLTHNPTTGAISGTPTVAGYYRVVQTASNAGGTATFTIPITIPGTPLALPFSDDFSSSVTNRYMTVSLKSPSTLAVTQGVLRYSSTTSDSEGALSARIPNLPLPLTNSWDVVVDARLPDGWSTPWSTMAVTLMPYLGNDTVETTIDQHRLNFKFSRDTEDPARGGNHFNRHAYTNDVLTTVLPEVFTNTTATRTTLRLSYHAGSRQLSTWYRPEGANTWSQLGNPVSLNPAVSTSLASLWSLSTNSSLGLVLWADSHATNGSAGQAMEFDNLSITPATRVVLPTLPATLSRFPGQPVLLSASPRDAGSYSYSWKRNGTNLPPMAAFSAIFGTTNHLSTYYLPSPTTADSGTYELTILKDGQPYATNSTVLTVTTNAPVGPGSDDFSTNTGRWNGVWGFDAHDAYLRLSSGRLEVLSDKAGSENSQTFYFWDSLLPTDRGWEVSVDAFLASSIAPPLAEDYFYHALRFGAEIPVHHVNQPGLASGLSVSVAEQKDGNGNRQRFVQNVLSITNDPGWSLLPPNLLTLSHTNVGLRLQYNSATKTLTSFYRTNSNSAWQTAGSNNLSSLPASQLTNGFRLYLGSIAEPSFLISEGQAFFDNFQLTYSNLPAPAPTAPAPLTNGLRGNLNQAFSYTPVWSNSPTSFSVTNLPPGLSHNPTTGAISGTPTVAGYYRVVQTASNAGGTATFTLPITILGTSLSLPFSDDFSSFVTNRYMPMNLGQPAELIVTNGILRYRSLSSDSANGATAAWNPNLLLPLTNSWDLVVDASMPDGWITPFAGLGLALFPYEDLGTLEGTAFRNRVSLEFGRDTDGNPPGGNFLGRYAFTNEVKLPGSPSEVINTPATRSTLRLSYHAGSRQLTAWSRTNGANQWTQLGSPLDLNPANSGSLARAWGLSNSSSLQMAVWGESEATNGSAGQAMEFDNLSITPATGVVLPTLPPALSRPPGQPLFLSASPRDAGSYSYSWKRNGTNLPPMAAFFALIGTTNHVSTYYLPNPTTADSGTYELTIFKDNQPYATNSTILTVTTNAPVGPGSDDFSTNSGRWNSLWGFDAHDAYLKLSSGRLQIVSDKAGSENTQAYLFWDSLLPTDRGWEVSVDAFLSSDINPPVARGDFYHALRLGAEIPVHHVNQPSGSGLKVALAEEEDGNGGRQRKIQNTLNITNEPGWSSLPSNLLTLSHTNVSLRLQYNSTTKTLTSSYRTNINGPWQTAASNNLSSLPPSQFTNGFRLLIGSIAEPSFLISEGQAFFDNFQLTYSNLVPPVSPTPLTNGLRGNLNQSFSYTPVWSNSPTSFSVTNLPPGLSHNPTTGAISGTPTVAGYYRVVQTASNAGGTATFTLPITILGTSLSLPFSEDFSSFVTNRYMPIGASGTNLEARAGLSNGVLRFSSVSNALAAQLFPKPWPDGSSDAFLAWTASLNLTNSSSWQVTMDASVPASGLVGLSIFPASAELSAEQSAVRRINLYWQRRSTNPSGSLATSGWWIHPTTGHTNFSSPPMGVVTPGPTSNTVRLRLVLDVRGTNRLLSAWGTEDLTGRSGWIQVGRTFELNPAGTTNPAHHPLGLDWNLPSNAVFNLALFGQFNQADQAGWIDNLSVQPGAAPTISLQPASTNLPVGQTANFSVTASGTDPLLYQWQFNGTNLIGATNAAFSRTNAQSSHAGSYSVVVSNLFGSVTSSVATLTVLSSPPVVTNNPAFLSTLSGGSSTLSVAASGDGPFTYQWRLNGTNLASATNANLSLSGLVASQAGAYSVVVSGPGGSTTNGVALVSVNQPLLPFLDSFASAIPGWIFLGETNRLAVTSGVLAAGSTISSARPPVSLPLTNSWVAEVDAVLTSSAAGTASLALSVHPESAETYTGVRPAHRLDLVLTPSGTNRILQPFRYVNNLASNLPSVTVPHQAVRLRLAHAPASGQLVLAWRATNAHSTWSDLAALPLNPTNSSVSNNLAPLWNLNSASKLRINMWGNQ